MKKSFCSGSRNRFAVRWSWRINETTRFRLWIKLQTMIGYPVASPVVRSWTWKRLFCCSRFQKVMGYDMPRYRPILLTQQFTETHRNIDNRICPLETLHACATVPRQLDCIYFRNFGAPLPRLIFRELALLWPVVANYPPVRPAGGAPNV